MAEAKHRADGVDDKIGIDEEPASERNLSETRARIEELLIPPHPDEFPRSETMRFLMGRSGKAVAFGTVAALLAAKPRLGMMLIRMLPVGRIVRRLF
jgi:hypothetical protein